MPKIGPSGNKVSIDPKAYAARITRAKKIVASMDPATRAKIKEMYPNVSKEAIANKALDTKKATMNKSKSMDKMPARKMPEGVKFPKNKKAVPNPPGVQRTPASGTKKTMPKTEGSKPGVKKPMPKVTSKPKPLTGPAAVAEIQRRTSPAGVKKAEMDAKKATNKKYPGLYKK